MKIYVLGIGAIGSNLTMNLAFDRRENELVIVDYDKVEARNYQFGTQQYIREQEGQSKVDALALNIYRATGRVLKTVNHKLTGESGLFGNESQLWIDCFDNYESRKATKDLAKWKDFDCLHVGFSPEMTFEIMWNEQYEVPSDTHSDFDICEAQGARSFIQYVSGLATNIIIEFLITGKKKNLVGNRFSIQEF